MTPINFTLVVPLAIKAAAVFNRRYERRFMVFALFVGLLVAVGFAVSGPDRPLSSLVILSIFVVVWCVVLAALLIVAKRIWLDPRLVRRNFREQRALSEPMTIAWTDRELVMTTGKSRTEMLFTDLHGFQASSDVVLLYRSTYLYHMVPIEPLEAAGQRESFLRRLRENGVREL